MSPARTTSKSGCRSWKDGATSIRNRTGAWTTRSRIGVPLSLTQYATPLLDEERLKASLGLYAQDQWTIKRLTLNLGLRFDYLNAAFRKTDLPAGLFVPARQFDAIACLPCWCDINPRIGAAYDLFGTGKTAVKLQHRPLCRRRGGRHRERQPPRELVGQRHHPDLDRRQPQLRARTAT